MTNKYLNVNGITSHGTEKRKTTKVHQRMLPIVLIFNNIQPLLELDCKKDMEIQMSKICDQIE